VLSAIADQSTPMNQPLEVRFTVADDDLAGLSLSARSSDQAVVPDSGLSLSGSGAARQLQITPVAGALGSTTITISATNSAGRSATGSFELVVSGDTPKKTASDRAHNDAFGRSVAISGDYAIVGSPNKNADEGLDIQTGAAYIFHRVGDIWTQQAKLRASDGSSHDIFGTVVAISGDYAVVGAPEYEVGPDINGAAYVFKRDGATWTEQAILTVTPGDGSSGYGSSVAISGETIVVGAWQIDSAGPSAGAAYVFQLTGDTWTEAAVLTASDGAENDAFGYAVAVHEDSILVGAPFDPYDLTEGTKPGAAYVFHRAEGAWSEQAKLTASDGAALDRFGSAVAISSGHALVGSPFDDDGADRTGSAYVFSRNGSDWVEQAKLLASDAERWDIFGMAVALSGDTAIVGSRLDDDLGDDSGSAYVYRLLGDAWTEHEKLVATDGAAGDWFGYSVAVSDEFYLVGAPGDDGVGFDSGASYFLRRIR